MQEMKHSESFADRLFYLGGIPTTKPMDIKVGKTLKDSSTDEGIKKLFTLLAGEEAKHKLRLEKIYDEEILK
jgi:hypothetical protein